MYSRAFCPRHVPRSTPAGEGSSTRGIDWSVDSWILRGAKPTPCAVRRALALPCAPRATRRHCAHVPRSPQGAALALAGQEARLQHPGEDGSQWRAGRTRLPVGRPRAARAPGRGPGPRPRPHPRPRRPPPPPPGQAVPQLGGRRGRVLRVWLAGGGGRRRRHPCGPRAAGRRRAAVHARRPPAGGQDRQGEGEEPRQDQSGQVGAPYIRVPLVAQFAQ